jgi:hypothetical protein
MIVGTIGDWYHVDYTVKGDPKFRSFKTEILKHVDVERQLREKIGRQIGQNPDVIEIYQAIRVVM